MKLIPQRIEKYTFDYLKKNVKKPFEIFPNSKNKKITKSMCYLLKMCQKNVPFLNAFFWQGLHFFKNKKIMKNQIITNFS